MAYIAYLYPKPDAAPHMEFLPDADFEQARAHAERPLAQHESSTFAEPGWTSSGCWSCVDRCATEPAFGQVSD